MLSQFMFDKTDMPGNKEVFYRDALVNVLRILAAERDESEDNWW